MLEFIGGALLGSLFGGGSTHTSSTRLVPYEKKVTINRAPTDESVKLLREMEEAARNQIHGVFVTKSNDFHGAVVRTHQAAMHGGYDIYVRFKLNGKTYESKFVLDELDIKFDKEGAMTLLFECMAKEIARQFTLNVIKQGI